MADELAAVNVMWDEADPVTPVTLSIQTPASGRLTVGLSTERAEQLASVLLQEVIEHELQP